MDPTGSGVRTHKGKRTHAHTLTLSLTTPGSACPARVSGGVKQTGRTAVIRSASPHRALARTHAIAAGKGSIHGADQGIPPRAWLLTAPRGITCCARPSTTSAQDPTARPGDRASAAHDVPSGNARHGCESRWCASGNACLEERESECTSGGRWSSGPGARRR